ncbi:MAG TPA: hypothetical protein VKV15_05000 [Bryobacteraceae bacterium]|nr:hypothetical protein [Bryobacteraceae bacterium]
MKTLLIASALLCSLAPGIILAQSPTITGVENNYSFTRPGLPNYGIAQGSIFDIFGSNLANTSTGLQSAPLQTTLNGVSVAVTVSGTTKQALLYYVTPTQIAAILPSSVPVGTGQITVTNNGTASAPAQIVVVQSAFGILTLNNGTGPAAAFDSKSNYLAASNAANPGDTILLWGTGAGPVPDDTKQAAVTAPIEVDIGGVPAKIAYAGRSQYPGLDQINVVVPSGLSGCYVSVVVRSGNFVSNFSSVPVANNSRTCSDVTVGLGPSASQIQSLAGKTTATVGGFGLSKININIPATVVGGITVSPANNYALDSGFASFQRVTLSQQFDPYVAAAASNTIASIGSCTVYSVSSNTSNPSPPSSTPAPALPTVTTVNLNAGPSVNVTGPNGTKSMPFANGVYSAQLGGGSGSTALPIFIPDTGGAFTFDNGGGGPDVSSFKTSLTFNPVVWSNMASLNTVQRSQGATVTWTGGDTSTYVIISGSSGTLMGTQYIFGLFTCTAPAAAHTFAIPAAVLLALPATGTVSAGGISIPISGSLGVMSYTAATNVSIPGIDLAYGYAYSLSSAAVAYQ